MTLSELDFRSFEIHLSGHVEIYINLPQSNVPSNLAQSSIQKSVQSRVEALLTFKQLLNFAFVSPSRLSDRAPLP